MKGVAYECHLNSHLHGRYMGHFCVCVAYTGGANNVRSSRKEFCESAVSRFSLGRYQGQIQTVGWREAKTFGPKKILNQGDGWRD